MRNKKTVVVIVVALVIAIAAVVVMAVSVAFFLKDPPTSVEAGSGQLTGVQSVA